VRGIDGGPRRFTQVVLNEQSLPVAAKVLAKASKKRIYAKTSFEKTAKSWPLLEP
jgi:hypothetical protein